MYTIYSQHIDDLHDTYYNPYPIQTFSCLKEAEKTLEKYRLTVRDDLYIYTIYFMQSKLS